MLLKTILNRVHRQANFVYGAMCLVQRDSGQLDIEVKIHRRANSLPICSGCCRPRSGYDRLPLRRFEFVPLWGIRIFFLYAMSRVDCPTCGVKVERVPWVKGKNHLTVAYAWFLSGWAKRLSWKEVAEVFHTSWENVMRSVKMAVVWGLEHRSLDGVSAIGIDEISCGKGHQKFATVVYQIDAGSKRLLWIGRKRTEMTLRRFFDWFGKERSAELGFICSDMWKPYLKVIAKEAKNAVNILDRFHIMSKMSKAIDEVRAKEVKELKAKGMLPVLTKMRWCLLKRPENLTENQHIQLKELLKCNLKAVRAYLLKEDFQFFWSYVSPAWAGKFLDAWCRRTMRSRIKPMKKIAKMLRTHRSLLLNWFRARRQIAVGAVEGFNNKAKVTTKRSYGFRSYDFLEIALYHTLGNIPEPEVTHKFC